jgi:CRISPR-associated endonuclease/helicase Cas3
MSATVDLDILDTIDNPARAIEPLILSAADREGDLGTRLQSRKRVSELVLPPDAKARAKAIAAAVRARHRPGSLSLVVVNTVDAARSVYDSLVGLRPAADLLLLHSRFRPEDRDRLVDRLMQQPGNDGRIVVSTQVVEAGVDLDAALLLTEACPWASFVQRSGRCNRAGLTADAEVLWFAPAKPDAPLPYSAGAVAATIAELRDIEGETIVPDGLGDRLPPVERPLLPVLRRRDLVNLFDTTPDLMGADIDVSPFVRDVSDDASVLVAWRDLDTTETREMGPRPRRPELCPVPIGEFRRWAKSRDAAIRRYDPARREWVRLSAEAVSPAMLVVVDRSAGGYEPDRGWDPALTGVVPEPTPEGLEGVADIGDATEDLDDDTPSFGARRDGAHVWVTLDTHLRDTEAAALALLDRIGGDLDLGTRAAVQASARLHDIGKAHEEFQRTLLRGADDRSEVRSAGLLAKSPHSQHRHARPGFRHELASALALLADSAPALGTVPTELQFLAVYLTAAHHGRIRMSLRSGPGDPPDRVLGIGEGDHLPEVTIGSQVVPDSDLHPLMIGGAGTGGVDRGDEPWHEQAQQLLARFGPFRLAYLEALVRFADYRATVDPSEVIPQ